MPAYSGGLYFGSGRAQASVMRPSGGLAGGLALIDTPGPSAYDTGRFGALLSATLTVSRPASVRGTGLRQYYLARWSQPCIPKAPVGLGRMVIVCLILVQL